MNLPAAVASWEQIKISIHFQTAHGYVEEPIKVLGFSKNNKRETFWPTNNLRNSKKELDVLNNIDSWSIKK